MRRTGFFVALALAFLTLSAQAYGDSGTNTLTPAEALQQGQSGDRLIVDIRRPEEWAATGVGKTVTALTMHRDDGPRSFLAKMKELVGGDLDRPIALICASGSRSSWAQQFLIAHGFTDVANVRAGMLGRGPVQGWIDLGLPTRSCNDCGWTTNP